MFGNYEETGSTHCARHPANRLGGTRIESARSSRGARALLALDLGGRFARAEDQLVRLLVRGLDRAELLSGGGGGGLRTGRGEGGGELRVDVLICAPTSSHSCESRKSERVRVA